MTLHLICGSAAASALALGQSAMQTEDLLVLVGRQAAALRPALDPDCAFRLVLEPGDCPELWRQSDTPEFLLGYPELVRLCATADRVLCW